ncbi:MAG: formylglycine-generating enzyme family protein [Phycisphaeraceae bacterium]
MPLRLLLCAMLLFLPACSPAVDTDAAEGGDAGVAEIPLGPGIVAERPGPADLPANAQVVALPGGGYMVPYEAEIPGFGVTYHMTPVPGGTFTMGSPPDEPGRNDDEGPQFTVEVEPFWMGTYEVTFAEYRTFTDMYNMFKQIEPRRSGGLDAPAIPEEMQADAVTIPTPVYAPKERFALGDDDDHPIPSMTHYAARQYTKWLSKLTGRFYRLPTEAEWEYAARAGTTTAWSFGDDEDRLADFANDYDPIRAELNMVGSLRPNAWGLYDMHGNVGEWVFDQYDPEHYSRFEGRGVVPWQDAINWPTETYPVVVRGGSLYSYPDETRSASRLASERVEWNMYDPNLPKSPWWLGDWWDYSMVGFRIIRPLREPDEDEQHRFWGSREQDLPEDLWLDLGDRLWGGRGTVGIVDENLPERLEQWNEVQGDWRKERDLLNQWQEEKQQE